MNRNAPHIRIGVLGYSDIARRRFLPAAGNARNAVVTAVGTRNADAVRHQLSGDGTIAVLSSDALLESSDVDLVYISLPNDLHERWTLRALDAGKHVLCEKPLGLTAASVGRMVASAREKGLFLGENIAYLLHPVHGRVRELIASGTIGRLNMLRANFGFRLTDPEDFRLDALRGGGAVHDLARYPLSAARYFLAGQEYTFAGYSFNRGELPISMIACGATSTGEGFSCSIGFEQQYECRYEIVGEKGFIRVERAFTTPADLVGSILLATGANVTPIPTVCCDHFQRMIEKAADEVLGNRDFEPWYGEALHLARLTDQLSRSCSTLAAGGER